MIKLFYASDTCSLASHIALEDAGAEYSITRISFANDEQRKPEYLAINPKGRAPALVTDKGVLTETPAILAFIAQSFPQARLAPLDDPFRFVPESVASCYQLIEENMLGGPWVMGETYTICDPYLFTMAQWLEQDGVDPSRFPKVMDHRRRMSERPAVQKAIAEELA
jgi:glutathione S-transferase